MGRDLLQKIFRYFNSQWTVINIKPGYNLRLFSNFSFCFSVILNRFLALSLVHFYFRSVKSGSDFLKIALVTRRSSVALHWGHSQLRSVYSFDGTECVTNGWMVIVSTMVKFSVTRIHSGQVFGQTSPFSISRFFSFFPLSYILFLFLCLILFLSRFFSFLFSLFFHLSSLSFLSRISFLIIVPSCQFAVLIPPL